MIAGRFFHHDELIHSVTADRLGIDNTPTDDAEVALQRLVDEVLDPLRELLGVPIRITSGYRSLNLNRAVKSRDSSQHVATTARGAAADGKCSLSSAEVRRRIYESSLPVSQCIAYHPSRGGHFHVSYSGHEDPPRRDFRDAPEGGGYPPWAP